MSYEDTPLWKSTLGVIGNRDVELLRNAYKNLRQKAEIICASIANDLSTYTVHDITHLDALWEMASLLCEGSAVLNPPEAFVLGGAILLHDAGLTVAAYAGGVKDILSMPEWPDTLASVIRQRQQTPPSREELENPSADVLDEAIRSFLRTFHARHAERLISQAYLDPTSGEPIFLIDDLQLRSAVGPTIGQIAASHWWSLSELNQKLGGVPDLGIPPQVLANSDWTINRFKLACLLRAADAIHLDSRRAPALTHAIRSPKGEADRHWSFQKFVHRPYVADQRVIFTSGHDFSPSEAPAWWQGYELLANADRELEGIDSLITDLHKDFRLSAVGVAGAKDPARLATLIPVQNWIPVEATVHVSDVAALVTSLGGYELYGENYHVPLRELLQNASDAIRARRCLVESSVGLKEDYRGRVVVRVEQEESATRLTIHDNGVGMSLNTLSKEFLDFGSSLWRSNRLSGEFPNLIRTPFAATGRYGIGFFSVFMWASQVKVVSRKFTAQDPTYVLEFEGGTAGRPIIRQATDAETLIGGGTAVSLRIKTKMIRSLFEEPDDVMQLCRWLCPAIDFDLFLRDGNQDKPVIRASDWLSLSGRELLERVIPIGSSLAQGESTDYMISAIRAISGDSVAIVGRASILDTRPYNDGTVSAAMGVITIGGFRANSLRGICGVVTGEPTTASRLSGRPAAPSEVFSRWATAQAQLLMSSTFSERVLNASAAVVREWGGDVLELPLGNSAHGWLRKTDHDKWRLFPNEVSVVAIAMMHTVPDETTTA